MMIAPQTCQDLKNLGLETSGQYMIDPDGPGVGDAPFMAECDLSGATGDFFAYFILLPPSMKATELSFHAVPFLPKIH